MSIDQLKKIGIKRMNNKLRFEISDSGEFVKAFLFEDENGILDYENADAKVVRVCVPFPNKEILLENLKSFAQSDPLKTSIESQFDFYIKCREKEIFEQVQEIRKSIKRIKKQQECIEFVKQTFNDYIGHQAEAKST